MSRIARARKTIILNEDELEFAYSEIQIYKFVEVWNQIRSKEKDMMQAINKVAKETGMLPDNVFLLALDQVRKRKIE